jgi:hypothetical protein
MPWLLEAALQLLKVLAQHCVNSLRVMVNQQVQTQGERQYTDALTA